MSENVNEINAMFDEEFGDLLGDSVTSTPAKPASVKPASTSAKAVVEESATPVNKVSAPAVEPVKSNDEFITFGTKYSAEPIPRFKAAKDTKARISILSKNILTRKFHYVEGIGSFTCFDGKCCEIEGYPKVRYVLPIVVYDTDKSGKILSDKLELKALAIGSDLYDALADAVGLSGRDVTQLEIIISCSDEKYQKLTFAVDNRVNDASWKTFATGKAIVEKYKENKSKLGLSVSRNLSPEMYLTKKGYLKKADTEVPGPFNGTNVEDLLDEK